jgi:hypothetical protein
MVAGNQNRALWGPILGHAHRPSMNSLQYHNFLVSDISLYIESRSYGFG